MMLERHLAAFIVDLLSLDDWHVFRMETLSRKEWGKGTGEPGMPDLLAIRYESRQGAGAAPLAEILWCEVKRRGERAKPHQTAWKLAERARGALVLTAGEEFDATPEGFEAFYRNSGLQRNSGTIGAKEAKHG